MKKALLTAIFITTSLITSQEMNGISSMDKDFLDSLPESVRADVLDEMKNRQKLIDEGIFDPEKI